MSSTKEETKETSLFVEPIVNVEEGELVIDEEASTVSLVPNPRVFPDLNAAATEGDECVRRAVQKIETVFGGHADCRAQEASERDGFVDIIGSL